MDNKSIHSEKCEREWKLQSKRENLTYVIYIKAEETWTLDPWYNG